jgi:hypothetical protein
MLAIKALYGQSLADVVYEEQLFEAADLNGGSITDALTAGDQVNVPVMAPRNLTNELVAPKVKPVVAKAMYGQTWVDLVVQQLGTEERLFELTDLNGAGITDVLQAGTIVETPTLELDKKSIVNVMQLNRPASDKATNPGATVEEGIEYWAVEFDFTVS